jgi:PhnB protein
MTTFKRPEGHHTITPGFVVQNAAKVINFLEQAFGGTLVERFNGPDGSVMHAEVKIGDSVVMLGETMPGMPSMPASLSLYVDDGAAVDATYKRALAAGATSETEPKNQFYGYRSATVRDMGGCKWNICAVIENVSHEEMQRRLKEMSKKH